VIYLDHNAGSPLRPEALAAMEAALRVPGNPSSVHAAGRAARDLLDGAREKVARALSCRASEIVFTSGATEAATLAVRGTLSRSARKGLVITAVEHPCIQELAHEFHATVIPVDRRGVPDLAALRAAVGPETALVAAMWANNETGVLQPVREIADLAHRAGALYLCDAAQAIGKLDVDLARFPADFLTSSAFKFGGPRGMGLLFVRAGTALAPVLAGHQERGRRAGTEDVPGACGLAAALEAAVGRREADVARFATLRDRLEAGLLAAMPGAAVNGAGADRLPHTLSIRLPGVDAEALLMALDLAGICASAGSACTSGSTVPSGVLTAMGLTPAEARSTLRLSVGWSSSETDVAAALEKIPVLAAQVKAAIPTPG
jgi:cysteine desulfurase